MAVEKAVLQTIEEGYEEGYWKPKNKNTGIDKLSCDDECIANIRG